LPARFSVVSSSPNQEPTSLADVLEGATGRVAEAPVVARYSVEASKVRPNGGGLGNGTVAVPASAGTPMAIETAPAPTVLPQLKKPPGGKTEHIDKEPPAVSGALQPEAPAIEGVFAVLTFEEDVKVSSRDFQFYELSVEVSDSSGGFQVLRHRFQGDVEVHCVPEKETGKESDPEHVKMTKTFLPPSLLKQDAGESGVPDWTEQDMLA
jgi:hypothetical protein